MTRELDISGNRSRRAYSRKEYLARVAWIMVRPLFRLSPRPCFAWRNAILRLMGATIGRNVHIYNSVRILMPWNLVVEDWVAIGEDCRIYNIGVISIGAKATISQNAHLCAGTHDYRDATLPLIRKDISIADQVWICADAFVGPGVKVATGAVVGACAVVIKDVAPWSVMVGNPARRIADRVLK